MEREGRGRERKETEGRKGKMGKETLGKGGNEMLQNFVKGPRVVMSALLRHFCIYFDISATFAVVAEGRSAGGRHTVLGRGRDDGRGT